ncbi:MAG: hypothetical protein KAX40_10610 [Herpetosiphon sp.]|nr:hypothetical protein [Herpetosiphon sp.]
MSKQTASRTTAEWVSLVIAIVLVVGIVGTIGWLWATDANDPPQFSIEKGETRQANNVYYLDLTVKNDGDQTASEVTLEGTIVLDGEPETAQTTFDFFPGHSEREATLIFSQDPQDADLRVISYQVP